MAQQLIRPLRHFPILHNHYFAARTTVLRLYTTVSTAAPILLPFLTTPSSHRTAHFKPRGLKSPNASPPSDLHPQTNSSDESDEADEKPSRNDKKREARRAVRWGMELAMFTESQIKRIISGASLEREVFEALVLVKTFGPHVREGKRRQYNLIGKLLKNAEPELMDTLIQATRDGDHSKVQTLSNLRAQLAGVDDKEAEEFEPEDNEEISDYDIDKATRWHDGLINKDIDITNEVYSIHSVDFDRQELRKLVRKVHLFQEQDVTDENKGKTDVSLKGAKKCLTRFLHSLANRMPSD